MLEAIQGFLLIMQSSEKTVAAYIKSLPADRQTEIKAVRKAILEYLPAGYKEVMAMGMIGYVVPLALYPKGYLNKPDQPLPFLALASQKNNLALYLMCLYMDDREDFEKAYKQTGKKLDMGKSCLRFKKANDVALEVVGKAIAQYPVKKFIKLYEDSRS